MDEQPHTTAPEQLELALRIMGNEVIAFSISSQSPRRNWIIVGLITMIVLAVVANQLTPLIQLLIWG